MSRQFDAKHTVLNTHPTDRLAGVDLFLTILDVNEADFRYEEGMPAVEYIYGAEDPAMTDKAILRQINAALTENPHGQ